MPPGESFSVRPPSCVCADLARLEQEVVNLERALASRELIGMAVGVIIARQRCTPDEAFDVLRRASQRENRRVRDIAEEMVERNAR